MIYKAWYLIQERAPNKNEWFTLDAPLPVCNSGSLIRMLETYRDYVGKSDYGYRIIVQAETVIISTEKIDKALKHPY